MRKRRKQRSGAAGYCLELIPILASARNTGSCARIVLALTLPTPRGRGFWEKLLLCCLRFNMHADFLCRLAPFRGCLLVAPFPTLHELISLACILEHLFVERLADAKTGDIAEPIHRFPDLGDQASML